MVHTREQQLILCHARGDSRTALRRLCSPACHHHLHHRPTSAFALHTHPAFSTLNVRTAGANIPRVGRREAAV